MCKRCSMTVILLGLVVGAPAARAGDETRSGASPAVALLPAPSMPAQVEPPAPPALAAPDTVPAPPSGQIPYTESYVTVRESYAVQVILVDVASVVLASWSEKVPLLVGGYLAGGPIVHAAHGNHGSAAVSLGLRVGLPLLGGAAFWVLSSDDSGDNDFAEPYRPIIAVGAGIVTGAVGAMVIDWGILSRDEQRVPATNERSLVVVPQVGVSENGVSLGVGGRF